jgi:hypothetical protein
VVFFHCLAQLAFREQIGEERRQRSGDGFRVLAQAASDCSKPQAEHREAARCTIAVLEAEGVEIAGVLTIVPTFTSFSSTSNDEMDFGSDGASGILIPICMRHECREIVEIVMRPQQRIDRRNHRLRYKHQLKSESTGDVDQGRRARSTASGFYLAIAGTRYARHVGNLLLRQLPAFTRSLQQPPDFQQGI